MQHVWTILDSICINYKTWVLYIVCATILADYNILQGIVAFLYAYFACYAGHYLMHMEWFYCNIYSISHNYHHINTEWFSYLINCIVEYLSLTNNIILKYIFIEFEIINLFFINSWMILFLYFLYTTVHNINYGIYRVNKYHSHHHNVSKSNIGPDIFDLLIGTKNKNTPQNEQIDHYIPNIIGSFLMVLLLKTLYESFSNKKTIHEVFIVAWALLTGFLGYATLDIFQKETKQTVMDEIQKFTIK